MSDEKAIQRIEGGALAHPGLAAESLEVLRNSVCPDHSDLEIQFFLQYCRVRNVDPFSKMIYSVVRTNSKGKRQQTFQTGIDCMRAQAETTGKYRGQVGPFWCDKNGQWFDIWLKTEFPTAAKVGVLRSDFDQPLFEIAKWDEYKPGEDWMWRKMPSTMLAKCAESKALRKAFPEKLAGIYSDDEMAQAGPAAKEVQGREYREDKPPAGCAICGEDDTVFRDEIGNYCSRHVPKPPTAQAPTPGEFSGPEYAFLDEVGPPQPTPAATDAPQDKPEPPVAIPEQAPRRRSSRGKTNEDLAADMSLFMRAAATWKGRLFNLDDSEPNVRYYTVLESLGCKHANELRGRAERLKALEGWSAAKAIPPASPEAPQVSPSPPAEPPAANEALEEEAAKLREEVAKYAGVKDMQVTAYIDSCLRGVQHTPKRYITILKAALAIPAGKLRDTILGVR